MGLCVLVVDDDDGFRRLAREILDANGMSVIGEAGTMQAARHAAATLRPDAALVDVGLPDGNGIDLARELAALAWAPRIVLTSTDAGIVDGDTALTERVVFVPKADLPTTPLLRLLARDP
jgi:DNA-binding NarL/FixJ family response regulator